MSMELKPIIMSIPIKNHVRYFNYILSNRDAESTNDAFLQKISIDGRTPLELLFHGTNNLFRASKHIINLESEFSKIDQERNPDLQPVEEAKFLYSQAINKFEKSLSQLSVADLKKTIKSPLSGNDITLESWISTNIMHTIGHVAQALKFQGMFCIDLNLFRE